MTREQLKFKIHSFIREELMNLYGLLDSARTKIDECQDSGERTEELIKLAVGKELYYYFEGLRDEDELEFSDWDELDEGIVQEEVDKFVWFFDEDGLCWDDIARESRLPELDPETMTDTECEIANSLQTQENFIMRSSALESLEKLSEIAGITTISVRVNSLYELRGKQHLHIRIVYDDYFDYEYDWPEVIINHPDKKFLVLFKIGSDTDKTLIAKLSSYLDAHAIGMGQHICQNFFSCLIYDGDGSNIPESIKRLCYGKIK